MKAKNNGTPSQCVDNLIKIVRGEVPMDRVRGINPRFIDSPSESNISELKEDIEWLVDTYEPRANLTDVDINEIVNNGDFKIKVEMEGA